MKIKTLNLLFVLAAPLLCLSAKAGYETVGYDQYGNPILQMPTLTVTAPKPKPPPPPPPPPPMPPIPPPSVPSIDDDNDVFGGNPPSGTSTTNSNTTNPTTKTPQKVTKPPVPAPVKPNTPLKTSIGVDTRRVFDTPLGTSGVIVQHVIIKINGQIVANYYEAWSFNGTSYETDIWQWYPTGLGVPSGTTLEFNTAAQFYPGATMDGNFSDMPPGSVRNAGALNAKDASGGPPSNWQDSGAAVDDQVFTW